MQELELQQFGWHMVDDLSDFDNMKNWQVAKTARRFECGSPNTLTTHALHASIELLLGHGMHRIENAVLNNVRSLIKLFSALPGIDILSPVNSTRHGGIFTFTKQGIDNQPLYEYLVSKGVVCAPRGGGIRFSPHYYNQQSELELLAELVEAYSV